MEEEILQSLTEELNSKCFEAKYGNPHTGGPQIRVTGSDFITYFVKIEDENFVIVCRDEVKQYCRDEVEREIPLCHPNALTAVFRYLDRKVSYQRNRRRINHSF